MLFVLCCFDVWLFCWGLFCFVWFVWCGLVCIINDVLGWVLLCDVFVGCAMFWVVVVIVFVRGVASCVVALCVVAVWFVV